MPDRDVFRPGGTRPLLRFNIPSWQRQLVWTESQQIKFIESAWLGFDLGSYAYNQGELQSPLDGILIDGQQRINAISEYWQNAFPVFGYRWSETTKVDRRFFYQTSFAAYVFQSEDEQALKDYYTRTNFSGTAHTDADRIEERN